MCRPIVGDMHGCDAEFQELPERAGLDGDDEIVALGDRGPDPTAALRG
jgi:hypothetical protein